MPWTDVVFGVWLLVGLGFLVTAMWGYLNTGEDNSDLLFIGLMILGIWSLFTLGLYSGKKVEKETQAASAAFILLRLSPLQ